ncbi:MAG TPA: hypothetical protein ENN66_05345 [Proteobacteria bacterium]|nr:hypothetical protein [Pseudomonadota bacterium]
MIWSIAVDLKQIQQQGKAYAWPRPTSCPRCRHWRLWGHGYALRYFDGFPTALPMKCYRCPLCGCVVTARPADYFLRIRSTMAVIVACLTQRLTRDRWPAQMQPRSRLRHWLSNLAGRVRIHLSETWSGGLLRGYDRLLERGQIPVARIS